MKLNSLPKVVFRTIGSLCLLTFLAAYAWAAPGSRRSENRADSLAALCERLGVGAGASVADVGCGSGADSLALAKIVGPRGTVFAQEIGPDKLKEVLDKAVNSKISNVVPVLGHSRDPQLPNGTMHLIYMRQVFHHFAQPRAMLRNFWFDLKPGGYLVIVDRQKGPLQDWTAMEKREKDHHWTSETAVTRMAREEGYRFHDLLDEVWNEKESFVLVFQRPEGLAEPQGDPATASPLDCRKLMASIPPTQLAGQQVLFCGLGPGRALRPVLLDEMKTGSTLHELILEEWMLDKEELPDDLKGGEANVFRTEKGALEIPENIALGMVVFAGAYHRLWEPVKVLESIRQRMTPASLLVIVDCEGPNDESRRLAHHRRRISPGLVRDELKRAGFELVRDIDTGSQDRWGLVFKPGREGS